MEILETQFTKTQPEYAGFWLRLAAFIIDYFVVGTILGILMVIIGLAMGLSAGIFNDMEDPGNQIVMIILASILGTAATAVSWLYYALMESGRNQGTLGKVLINLKVTDLKGERISFSKATGRYFGKLLSSLFILGYIMIGFTSKKQGLHDLLSECLVVKK